LFSAGENDGKIGWVVAIESMQIVLTYHETFRSTSQPERQWQRAQQTAGPASKFLRL